MVAKDRFHDAVRTALEKEGWIITDDPLSFRFGGVDVHIDLAAERLIAAERDGQKIAVEIKSFLGASVISEFHTALGQFMNYRTVLRRKEPERALYLAVPQATYDDFFQRQFTQAVIEDYQLSFVVYDVENEVITQWHP
ncbi:MAG: XisH family protein [Oculatellaceae cyanobacterium bins.114]|nr:XisH family protein [Oculatellaceae cyanobacterium bins.114]